VAMTLVRGCHACRAFPAAHIAIYNWGVDKLVKAIVDEAWPFRGCPRMTAHPLS
jgi:hypothetical protein